MTETKKVVIDRSKWRCGDDGFPANAHGTGTTSLLNSEGFMCCLGFAAQQLGDFNQDDLLTIGEPSELPRVCHPLNFEDEDEDEEGYLTHDMKNSDLSDALIGVNDDKHTSRQDKEAAIKATFATAKIEVEFIGEYTS